MLGETLVSLREAGTLLSVDGKPIDYGTLFRWARHGARGHRLETCLVGGKLCTSHEALRRFIDLVSASGAASGSWGSQARPRTTPQRERDIADAKAIATLPRFDPDLIPETRTAAPWRAAAANGGSQ
jgi:hypothetical protein